jgi:hypothetical protein
MAAPVPEIIDGSSYSPCLPNTFRLTCYSSPLDILYSTHIPEYFVPCVDTFGRLFFKYYYNKKLHRAISREWVGHKPQLINILFEKRTISMGWGGVGWCLVQVYQCPGRIYCLHFKAQRISLTRKRLGER